MVELLMILLSIEFLHQSFLCVNASNSLTDFLHLRELSKPFDCAVKDISSQYGLIAVQGPKSAKFLEDRFEKQFSKINRMKFSTMNFWEHEIIVARTGYTGEDGFEIFLPVEIIKNFAESLDVLDCGDNAWIGLAARDSLRLEAGFCLHGHEISEKITPLEAGVGWAVSFDKDDFLGKQFLVNQKKSKEYGRVFHYEVEDRRIPREGAPVIFSEDPAGIIMSGGYSPVIKAPIGTAYIEKDFLESISIGKWYAEVRGKLLPIKFSKPVMKQFR